MPELPEVEALASYVRTELAGQTIRRIDVVAIPALKTYDPTPTTLHGGVISTAHRYGKFLDIETTAGLHLVVHFSRAGWLHHREQLPAAPPRPGKGPIALRVHLADGSGFDLTEAGTKKRLAIYLVSDPTTIGGIARLGPDALAVPFAEFADRVRQRRGQLKRVLTDQSVIAGIGNAYSDEILHRARLSPYARSEKCDDAALHELHAATGTILSEATARAVAHRVAELKAEKRSGLLVHGRTGLPCPVCGDLIREVAFADRTFQYCPTCQTGGKPLADRRLSRLVR